MLGENVGENLVQNHPDQTQANGASSEKKTQTPQNIYNQYKQRYFKDVGEKKKSSKDI